MNARVVAEALIRAATKPAPDAADEYATAAALLRTSTPAAGAELLRILATEVAAARDADMHEQAVRRHLA